MHRNTPPRTGRATAPLWARKPIACLGSSAVRTTGWRITPLRPSPEITKNHSSMIGPNAPPIFCVPNRWAANSAISMPTAIGIT